MIFIYIFSILSCILFSHSASRVESFTPLPRYSVSSILIDSKIYFFGGWGKNSDGSESCQNSLFYLDISSSFSTSGNIPWTDLTSIAAIPVESCWQAIALDGLNKSVYMFEGLMVSSTNKVDTLIYAFDTKTKRWNIPTISGVAPIRRSKFQIAQDSSDKIYMFGGSIEPFTGSQNTTWFSDMNVFDITRLSWLIVVTSGLDLPPPQTDFTATMLTNGMIVYIGGRQTTTASGSILSYKKMDQIWTYDTKKGFWNLIIASGAIPGVRSGHSAVLAMGGRIIIYGGKENDDLLSPATPDLAVLDTASTPPYQWSTPKAFNIAPPTIAHHSATLIGNIMIIAFGSVTLQTTMEPGPISNIYLLDISNYTWITSFDINSSNTTPTTDLSTASTTTYSIVPSTSTILSSNVAIILGVTIGCSVSLIIILVIAFLLIRRWLKFKKENKGLTNIPSSAGDQ